MRTSPRTTAPVQALIQRGFRFEVLRYGPANGFVPEPVDLRLLANPRDAIRILRVQLRSSHVLGLTPYDAGRALYMGRPGRLGAGARGAAPGGELRVHPDAPQGAAHGVACAAPHVPDAQPAVLPLARARERARRSLRAPSVSSARAISAALTQTGDR